MATVFILIFLLITVFLSIAKYRRLSISTLIFTSVCFLVIGSGLIPSILLKNLQSPFVNLPSPLWKKQNAIVLLGAGTVKLPISNVTQPTVMAYSRITKAASLYLECVKHSNRCTIIISGGAVLKMQKSEAVVYRDILLSLGINNNDIKLEANSMNTYENAKYTSIILHARQFDQVILVTSGIHLKRALLYFSHLGINAKPVLSDYLTNKVTLIPVGYNFAIIDFAIHEYLGMARFYVYKLLGWNDGVSAPGVP